MTDTQATPSGNEAKPGRITRYVLSTRGLFGAFAFFCLAVMAGGYHVFHDYKEVIKTDRQNELAGIAELKAGQIANWMMERRGDAQSLKDDSLFLFAVDRWLQQGEVPGEAKAQLTARLASMQKAYAVYGYASVSLFDDKAKLLLSSSADGKPVHGEEKVHLLESIRSGQIVFSEINRNGISGSTEIELRAPLILEGNGKKRTIGAILFRIDPYRFLYPLIQRWPTPSPSAESLLVQRVGDEVVFLNELRHRKNTALDMHLPLSNLELPAAMAALGQEGMVEGVDYRGVPVVAVLNKIPGTSWILISKIDQAEIYAPIESLAAWVLISMLALIGVGGGGAAYWWRLQRRHIHMLEKQLAQELEGHVLSKHMDYLAKYANDIILLHDSAGNIIEFNDRALEAYGYTETEFASVTMADIRAAEFAPSFEEKRKEIDLSGAQRFESTHVRKSGSTFPVETSVRLIDIAGKKFYQAIIRDITERKQAENELARQNDFIRLIIDSDPNLIFVKDAEGRFLLANKAMAESYGQTTDGIVGKHNSDFIHNAELLAAYERANLDVIEGRQERMALETGSLADGKSHSFQTFRKPLIQADGSISVLTIATDVTSLKQAEERLCRLNRALRLLGECNAALIHNEEDDRLLTEICQLIVEVGDYRMAWVGIADHGLEKSVHPTARYGHAADYLDGITINWSDDVRGCGPIGIAIKTGMAQVNHDSRSNPAMAPWRDAAIAHGYLSSIALPLKVDGEVIGVLAIYAAQTDAFSTGEILLLEDLADNLAFGMATQRLRAERAQAVEKLEKSEEHFRFLTENATDMVFLMSPQTGLYTYVSPASTRLFGYTPEEFYDNPGLMHNIIHPDCGIDAEQQWERGRAVETPSNFEYCITHKSGALRWMIQRNAPIWRDGGDFGSILIQGVVTDITERKLAEAQLESERTRLRTLVQTIPDLVWLKDANGVYLGCNLQFECFFGAKEADVLGKTDYDLVDAELADHFRQKDREAMQAGKARVNEEWITYPDSGQRVLFETIKTPMHDESGNLIGVIGIARNITERKQAAERESRLHHVLDSTLDMIFMFHPDTLRFVYMNKGAIDGIGYGYDELLQMTPADIKPLLTESEFRELIAPLVAGEKKMLRFETLHRHKDGTDIPVEVQLQLVQEQNGESVFVAIVRDIAERRRAENELLRQKAFMWKVIDADPNQIFVKDAQGNFLLVNQSLASAYGLSPREVVGRNNAEINLFTDEVEGYLKMDREVIEEGREVSLVEPFTLPSGEQRWFLTLKKRLVMPDGKLSVLGIAVDITDQKLSELKLSESYKKLQRLSMHLENARTDERARIALNLHDEMGATLVAIKMGVAWLASKLPVDMPQLESEVTSLTGLVSGGIHTMRQIVTELRPNLLGDVGLAAAIQDYVNKFQQHSIIECMLVMPDSEFALDSEQSLTIFRILQESLNNVAKHAQARKVSIRVMESTEGLIMEIEDDGIGFDLSLHKEHTFGLLGIRERALMVGGKARILSAPGKGVCVSVSIPYASSSLYERDSHEV